MLPRRNLEATGAVGVIYDRFPSVDPSGSFAGILNLSKPLYKENTVYGITHKNRPIDHPGET